MATKTRAPKAGDVTGGKGTVPSKGSGGKQAPPSGRGPIKAGPGKQVRVVATKQVRKAPTNVPVPGERMKNIKSPGGRGTAGPVPRGIPTPRPKKTTTTLRGGKFMS